ncbi:radical SAM protein [Nanoarchaeota archaeon]
MEKAYRLSNYGEKAYEALSEAAQPQQRELTSRFYNPEEIGMILDIGKSGSYLNDKALESGPAIHTFADLMRKGIIEESSDHFNPLHDTSYVIIDLTYRCNFNCNKCYHQSDKEELSTEEVKEVIDVLKGLGLGSFNFHGGEPTLRKDLAELVGYASEGGKYFVSTITNGSNITQDYLQNLVDNGLNIIYFSIDGIGQEHDRMRNKPGSFDSVVEAVNIAKSISEHQHYQGKNNLMIGINSTLEDASNPEQFKQELEKYVRSLKLSTEEVTSPTDVYLTIVDRIFQVGNGASHETRDNTSKKGFDDLRNPTCTLNADRLLIRPDGTMGHCWLGYSGREYGKLDRSSLQSIGKSLIQNLNSTHETPEYRLVSEGNIQDAVKFVDRELFPEKYERFCTPLAITLGVWDNMHRLAEKTEKEINDPEIVKESNRIVAEAYKFKKSQ